MKLSSRRVRVNNLGSSPVSPVYVDNFTNTPGTVLTSHGDWIGEDAANWAIAPSGVHAKLASTGARWPAYINPGALSFSAGAIDILAQDDNVGNDTGIIIRCILGAGDFATDAFISVTMTPSGVRIMDKAAGGYAYTVLDSISVDTYVREGARLLVEFSATAISYKVYRLSTGALLASHTYATTLYNTGQVIGMVTESGVALVDRFRATPKIGLL